MIPALTHELRARLRYTATQALAHFAKETPEAKEAIHDYMQAVAPATVMALLDENERFRAMIEDLLEKAE